MRPLYFKSIVMPTQYFNLAFSVITLPGTVAYLRPGIFKDGDMWCIVYELSDSTIIRVKGNTPEMAIMEFDEAYNKWLKASELKQSSVRD